jgi:hypothetical protein
VYSLRRMAGGRFSPVSVGLLSGRPKHFLSASRIVDVRQQHAQLPQDERGKFAQDMDDFRSNGWGSRPMAAQATSRFVQWPRPCPIAVGSSSDRPVAVGCPSNGVRHTANPANSPIPPPNLKTCISTFLSLYILLEAVAAHRRFKRRHVARG